MKNNNLYTSNGKTAYDLVDIVEDLLNVPMEDHQVGPYGGDGRDKETYLPLPGFNHKASKIDGVTQPADGPANPDGEPLPQWKKGVMKTNNIQPGHWEDEDLDGDNRPLPAQTKIETIELDRLKTICEDWPDITYY